MEDYLHSPQKDAFVARITDKPCMLCGSDLTSNFQTIGGVFCNRCYDEGAQYYYANKEVIAEPYEVKVEHRRGHDPAHSDIRYHQHTNYALNPYYHGSPYRGLDLSAFEGNIFFLTPSLDVASHYTKALMASGHRPHIAEVEDAGTIYSIDIDIDPSEIFDTRNSAHKQLYDEIRTELKRVLDPEDWPSPRLTATPALSDSKVSGYFPDFGAGLNIVPALKEMGFRALWVSEGSQGASLGLFYPEDATIIDSQPYS